MLLDPLSRRLRNGLPPCPESKWVHVVSRMSSILNVTDPYNPAEIDRSGKTDLKLEDQNGCHQGDWGAYEISHRLDVCASDRNCGLSTFREFEPDDGDDDNIKDASKDHSDH